MLPKRDCQQRCIFKWISATHKTASETICSSGPCWGSPRRLLRRKASPGFLCSCWPCVRAPLNWWHIAIWHRNSDSSRLARQAKRYFWPGVHVSLLGRPCLCFFGFLACLRSRSFVPAGLSIDVAKACFFINSGIL